MEREISDLRSTNKRLGKSVGWIVDVLLQDEDGVKELQRLKEIQTKKREALESLAYVRDVLNGGVGTIEEERLSSEQELEKRKVDETVTRNSQERGSSEIRNKVQIHLPPPAQMPVGDARIGGSRNSQKPSFSMPLEQQPNPSSIRAPHSSTRPLHSSTGPLSASPHVPTPSGHLAPWHSTRSSFSGATSPVATALPQVPPPMSATYQPPRIPSPAGQVQSSSHTQNMTRSRSPRLEVQHDPLGVL